MFHKLYFIIRRICTYPNIPGASLKKKYINWKYWNYFWNSSIVQYFTIFNNRQINGGKRKKTNIAFRLFSINSRKFIIGFYILSAI